MNEPAPAPPRRKRRDIPFFLSAPLWLVVSGLGLAASALPRPLELALGRAFGRWVFALGLFRNRICEENVSKAMPEKDAAARRALLRANYEHYGILFFEFCHFFSPLPGHYPAYAREISRLENKDIWEKARAKGKGVLFFSAHTGFWEMSAAAAGLNGLNPTIVTKVLKPAWLHDRVTAARSSTGVDAAFHPGSMPSVMRVLRKGGSVAFMNDQYAPPPMGTPVVFFGLKVDTLAVVGPLAKRTGAVVLPVSSFRDARGVNVVRIEEPLDLETYDATEATQRVAAHVEGWVRKKPEQWLWLHRRFKHAVPA